MVIIITEILTKRNIKHSQISPVNVKSNLLTGKSSIQNERTKNPKSFTYDSVKYLATNRNYVSQVMDRNR